MHDRLINELAADHRQFEQILDAMLDTNSNDIGIRQELVLRLQLFFLAHSYGEEQGLFVMLKGHDETRALSLRSLEEHHVARVLLDELVGLPSGNESWQAKAAVLSLVLRYHIESEERLVFMHVRHLLSAEEAERALRILDDEKHTELAAR